jgi:hypothetical protein
MKEKNYNPTGKQLFVVYQCPKCGRNDASYIPPVMKQSIPFFIPCGCGGYVMYHGAWITDPVNANDVLTSFMVGENTFIKDLKPDGKFKNVTDQLDPDGTMDMSKMLNVDIDMAGDKIDPLIVKSKKKGKITSAKQVCPVCGNEFIIKDIDLYLERLNEAWDIVIEHNPGIKEKYKHEIYKRNNPEYIRKHVDENGFFTAFCQPCMNKISWSSYLGLGL